MLGRWISHALIYLSVCITASLVWVVLTDGTIDDLRAYGETPADALTVDFWPVWFWLMGGAVLAVHFAVVVGRLLPGRRRWSRENRALVEQAREAVAAAMPDLSALAPPSSPSVPYPVAASHSPGPPERRYVVAMFTDLSDSTAVNERIGDEAWAEVVAEHRAVVRACMANHGGEEVSTQGDGFFVRFDDPRQAADCAVEIQQRCRAQRAQGAEIPPVRMGIHVGDAVHGDHDVLGHVVNVAARLLEVARPHQILVTEPVADIVSADRLDDRGLVSLKGMSQPRHVLSIRWDSDAAPASPASPADRAGSVTEPPPVDPENHR